MEKFRRFETETSQPKWLLPIRKAGLARFSELLQEEKDAWILRRTAEK